MAADVSFLVVLAVVLPITGAVAMRRWLAAGPSTSAMRIQVYLRTIGQLWLMAAVAFWVWGDRPLEPWRWAAPAGWQALVAVGVNLALLAVLIASLRSVRTIPLAKRAEYRSRLGAIERIAPRDRREYAWFVVVSLSAGITEELVYRGYLTAAFEGSLGRTGAVLLSSFVFGLGHAYQGLAGVLRTAAVGLAFAAIVWITGSLWPAIIAHALVDILQGAALKELMRSEADGHSA